MTTLISFYFYKEEFNLFKKVSLSEKWLTRCCIEIDRDLLKGVDLFILTSLTRVFMSEE